MKDSYIFIAGGIGITPFRSMITYLLDTGQKPSIVLFYIARDASEIVFLDVLERAENEIGLRVVYVFGKKLTAKVLQAEVLDFQKRVFYVSGAQSLVTAYQEILLGMGIG